MANLMASSTRAKDADDWYSLHSIKNGFHVLKLVSAFFLYSPSPQIGWGCGDVINYVNCVVQCSRDHRIYPDHHLYKTVETWWFLPCFHLSSFHPQKTCCQFNCPLPFSASRPKEAIKCKLAWAVDTRRLKSYFTHPDQHSKNIKTKNIFCTLLWLCDYTIPHYKISLHPLTHSHACIKHQV